MATLADVIKKYGSMEAFKAANPNNPQPTAPNTFSSATQFAASTATPAVTQNTKSVAPTYSGPNQNVFNNADGTQTYNQGQSSVNGVPVINGVAQRQPATVATSTNPVISKTNTTAIQYDPANPKDYLMEIQARLATGGKPLTAPEYKQFLIAQEALNNQNKDTGVTDPFSSSIATSQSQLDKELLNEKNRDSSALGAFKTAVDARYANQAEQLTLAGQKRKDAEQRVYSFSGFGRSTAAADAQGQIEKETQSALGALEAAKQAEIAAKQAELEGADSDTVAALRSQVGAYQKASQDFQIASIKATAEANQKGGADYMEAINNFMTTAAKNKIDIGDPKVVEAYAKIARNADGTINEGVIKSLPPEIQAIIRSAAETTQASTKEFKYIQGDKYNSSVVFDPSTGKFVLAPGGKGGSGGAGSGSGGGAGGMNGAGGEIANELLTRVARIKDAVGGSYVRGSGLLDPDIQADLDYLKSNLTLDAFLTAKKRGATFGSMTEGEWKILGDSMQSISSTMSKEALNTELNRLTAKLGGVVTANNTGKAPSQGASTPAPATTAPAKNNAPQSTKGVDFALSLMD